MIVHTDTEKVVEARKTVLDLILSNHDRECLTCVRNGNCELQRLAQEFGVTDIRYRGERNRHEIDDKSPSIVRDFNKCVLCRRCISTCTNVQGIGAIDCTESGFSSCISTAENRSLNDVNCTFCGQCIENCPVGALKEKDSTEDVRAKLKDKNTYVIVQTAPAVRVALGEEFGLSVGTNVQGKMVTALKKLGFDKVFDTNTGADFTIMEEGTELIHRLQGEGTLPMITSCCPAWVRYAEMNYPESLSHLSSCKSPHQMFGAILKTYYAEKNNIDPKSIYTVSVMPCIAKKFERTREEMQVDGLEDVDAVITTRELARMIKASHIEFVELEDSEFDNPMGEATGAAAIFGVTGGVMEAALRTVKEILEGEPLEKLEFTEVRGKKGIKTAVLNIADRDIKIAAASGLENARVLMEEIKNGTSKYDFIEIMACPGGCILGGGQPIKSSKTRNEIDIYKKRAEALYTIDEKSKIRKSHENPYLKEVYRNYLKKAGGELPHKLLLTTYQPRKKYDI